MSCQKFIHSFHEFTVTLEAPEGRDAFASERLLDYQNSPAHHGNPAIPVLQQSMVSATCSQVYVGFLLPLTKARLSY